MENESKGSCVAVVISVVGFLANIVNLISLAQFIMSLRGGHADKGLVETFYLPFPLAQDDYALIAGSLLSFGTVATGVFLWFFASNQIHTSQFSKLLAWIPPQFLVVVFFTLIYWLAFKNLLRTHLEISSFMLFFCIILFLLVFPGIVSYYLYEGWSHPKRRR